MNQRQRKLASREVPEVKPRKLWLNRTRKLKKQIMGIRGIDKWYRDLEKEY